MPKYTVEVRRTTTHTAKIEGVEAEDEDAAAEAILSRLDKEDFVGDHGWELDNEEFDCDEVFEE